MRVQHLLLVLPLCVENRREAEMMVGEVEEEADAMYELHDNVVVSGCGWSLEVKRVLLGRTKALLHCSPIKSRAPMVNVLGLFLSKVRRKLVVFGSGRERLYTRERAKALARKITCELLTVSSHYKEQHCWATCCSAPAPRTSRKQSQHPRKCCASIWRCEAAAVSLTE
jgi:hypothetical protein